MVTRQAHVSREKRRSIRLKTDSMQTSMKMDRKRKRAADTAIRNVRWSSVFWKKKWKKQKQNDDVTGLRTAAPTISTTLPTVEKINKKCFFLPNVWNCPLCFSVRTCHARQNEMTTESKHKTDEQTASRSLGRHRECATASLPHSHRWSQRLEAVNTNTHTPTHTYSSHWTRHLCSMSSAQLALSVQLSPYITAYKPKISVTTASLLVNHKLEASLSF